MTSAVYSLAKQAMMSAGINMPSDTIRVQLVANSYTPSFTTDQYLSAISSGARIGSPVILTSPTVTAGVFNAANATFSAVPSGSTVNAVVIYKDTGSAATSPLIAYIDQISGFPITPSGADIAVNWDTGTYKIFAL